MLPSTRRLDIPFLRLELQSLPTLQNVSLPLHRDLPDCDECDFDRVIKVLTKCPAIETLSSASVLPLEKTISDQRRHILVSIRQTSSFVLTHLRIPITIRAHLNIGPGLYRLEPPSVTQPDVVAYLIATCNIMSVGI